MYVSKNLLCTNALLSSSLPPHKTCDKHLLNSASQLNSAAFVVTNIWDQDLLPDMKNVLIKCRVTAALLKWIVPPFLQHISMYTNFDIHKCIFLFIYGPDHLLTSLPFLINNARYLLIVRMDVLSDVEFRL